MGRTAATEALRRNRVNEPVVALIAGIAAFVACLAGAEPTGQRAGDVALVLLGVVAVTWGAASAPWWAVTAASGVAAATSNDVALIVIGGVAFLSALWDGVQRRDLSETRAVITGVALNVLIRSELGTFFGLSAIVGCTIGAALFVVGLARRPRTIKRIAWITTAAGAALLVLATALFGASVASSRQALKDGNDLARAGIDSLSSGDIDEARDQFERAASAFERADDNVAKPWNQPARLVPVVAQHRAALVELTSTATVATDVITTQLEQFDLDRLKVIDGRIDLAAVRDLQGPLAELQRAVDDLEIAVGDARSPWLVDQVTRRLDNLQVQIDEQQLKGENAELALHLAPALLGADGQRTYFLAFTTPAEARGHGGFMGNWAELTVTDGRIELTRFGRTADLNQVPTPRFLTGPDDWIARYGRFGFTSGPDGATGGVPWQNITLSAHFPSTAQVMAELYPQSGGQEVDGVFALDVTTLADLLLFTGPIDVEGLDERLTSENAEQYLLFEQYLLPDNEQRIDALEGVARTTVDRLLGGELPSPDELARTLGPRASQGRLTAWAVREEEQELFEQVNMSGALPALEAGDGLAVTVNNASGNKIENFLDVDVHYVVEPDWDVDEVSGDLTITLTNSAPASGLPRYLIGNSVGLPEGTNRLILTMYTRLTPRSATLDGQPFDVETGTEAGYLLASQFVDIPPGGTRVVTLHVAGDLNLDSGYRLVVRTPPAVRPFPHTISVERPDGIRTDHEIDLPGIERIQIIPD